MKFFKRKEGFTLTEMLVVISVMGLMLTSAYTYSRSSEKQISVLREQAKVVETASRAKSLSLTSYGEDFAACGYGIHFEKPQTMVIFRDLAEDCSRADKRFDFGDGNFACGLETEGECLERYVLERNVVFSDDTVIRDVIFIPPDPETDFFPDALNEAIINIVLPGTDFEKTIKINSAGQITAL